jgi:hypothetical protein
MRASTADRERAIDVLKAAFAEGRLDQDEYTERAADVYKSRTYAELAALTADLPVGPLGTLAPQPSRRPEPLPLPSAPMQRRRRRSPLVFIVLALLVLAGSSDGPAGVLGILPLLVLVLLLTRFLL